MTHTMLKNAPGALLIEFLTPILLLICVSVRCGDSVGGGRHSVCLGSVWRYGHKLLIKSHTPHRSLPKKGLRSRGLFEHLSSALFKSDIRSRSKVSHQNAEPSPKTRRCRLNEADRLGRPIPATAVPEHRELSGQRSAMLDWFAQTSTSTKGCTPTDNAVVCPPGRHQRRLAPGVALFPQRPQDHTGGTCCGDVRVGRFQGPV